MKFDTDDIVVLARKAAVGAGKKVNKFAAAAEVRTGDAIDKAKLGYRVMELKTEIAELKRKVGDLVCRAHRGEDICQTDLDDLLFALDAKIDELEGLKIRRDSVRIKCKSCGKICSAASKFCNECGAELRRK
ncbi:MAG: hypothetical protein IKZ19_09285 [Clostridia bacterium]|nr:hypothetical protein [Clostridia bacterium]